MNTRTGELYDLTTGEGSQAALEAQAERWTALGEQGP